MSDYLWDSEEKELLNEELKVEKAEREISNEEIEFIFKEKKKGKKYKKAREKRNKRTYIIDYNRTFLQVWMDKTPCITNRNESHKLNKLLINILKWQ